MLLKSTENMLNTKIDKDAIESLVKDLDYDYELYRKCAFVIHGNKAWESELHFDAMLDILETKGYDRNAIYHENDENLAKKIEKDLIMGEVANIEGTTLVLAYDIEGFEAIRKHYPDKVIVFHKGGNLKVI